MKYVVFVLLAVVCSPIYALHNEVVAAVIVHEAGGEGRVGMQAVANVILNRTRVNKDAYAVVTRRLQFSCLNGKSHDTFVASAKRHSRWTYAVELTEKIGNKTLVDITGGATHYFNPTLVNPSWASKMEFKKKIGNHDFYKEP